MKVPFVDLTRIHDPLKSRFLSEASKVIDSSSFTNGPDVKQFENAFSAFIGTKYCVGLSSGTDAGIIGLRAIGFKPGMKAVVPAMTFIATIEFVTHLGGIPVLVDVDERGLIDLNQAEEAIRNTGAKILIPVHLFGQMIHPNDLKTLAEQYDIKILEDACQAHGARINGIKAGSIGTASAFSFYPGKNLGALGDAGALCTNDEEIYKKARALREHGQTEKNYFEYEGYTARLHNLQAAFLNVKLPYLDEWNQMRIEAVRIYVEKLGQLKNARFQHISFQGDHIYHLLILLTSRREQLIQAFQKHQIGYGLHYPVAIHQLPCYRRESWCNGKFPRAEEYADQGISLPLFPGITEEEIDAVVHVIKYVCS